MVGGVFGNLNGVAPGYLLTLSYKQIQLYSQGEYVFDTQNRGGSYFYCWNQITYSPLKWLEVGLVSQRTRVYQRNLDVQRGVLISFTYKRVNFTTNLSISDGPRRPRFYLWASRFECGADVCRATTQIASPSR